MARTVDTYDAWLALSAEDRDAEPSRWRTQDGENRHIAEEAARRLLGGPRPVTGLRIARWVDGGYAPLAAVPAPLLVPLVGSSVGIWHGDEYVLSGWVAPVHAPRAPMALTWSFEGFRVIFHFPPHLCPTCDDDERVSGNREP